MGVRILHVKLFMRQFYYHLFIEVGSYVSVELSVRQKFLSCYLNYVQQRAALSMIQYFPQNKIIRFRLKCHITTEREFSYRNANRNTVMG